MILAASPNTIRSLARQAGLRAADVYIKDASWGDIRATEVYLRSPAAVGWICDIRDRFERFMQCPMCGYFTPQGEQDELCPACPK